MNHRREMIYGAFITTHFRKRQLEEAVQQCVHRLCPTRAARGVELAMSQNITVTSLCSPSCARREGGISWTRCGEERRCWEAASGLSRTPHCPQNFCESGLSCKQAEHFIIHIVITGKNLSRLN